MPQVKIKVTRMYNTTSDVKNVENQLLLGGDNHRIIMFTNVQILNEDETYGRKKNKTRKVKYLLCTLKGWNAEGDFVGEYDESHVDFFLQHRNLLRMRRTYLDFEKQYTAMKELQDKHNS